MRWFIAGSDTEVGKTEFTAYLIGVMRSAGIRVGAVKPFCSGSLSDLERLSAALGGDEPPLSLCWRYLDEPIAPFVALHMRGESLDLEDLKRWTMEKASEVDVLLIEGIGGLMTPLAEGYTNLEMAKQLAERVAMVVPNVLGSLNATLLTMAALKGQGLDQAVYVVNDRNEDLGFDKDQNFRAIERLCEPLPVCRIPYMPVVEEVEGFVGGIGGIGGGLEEKIKKALAGMFGFGSFLVPLREGGARE